jgi:hypothetical protein
MFGATRSKSGLRSQRGRVSYLNTPPMTKAKKITAATKIIPATTVFLKTAPRRAAGLRSRRRGSNLEDRNLYYRA